MTCLELIYFSKFIYVECNKYFIFYFYTFNYIEHILYNMCSKFPFLVIANLNI